MTKPFLPKRIPPLAELGKLYVISIDYDPGAHYTALEGIAYRNGRLERIIKRVQTHPGLPTANHRLHHHERAQIVTTIQQLAWAAAFNARTPRFERCHAEVTLYFTRNQRRDTADNMAGAIKPIWDALRSAGVLADDDTRHLTLDRLTLAMDATNPRIELVLRGALP